MLVFEDFGAEAAKHASQARARTAKRRNGARAPLPVVGQAEGLIRLLDASPADLAEAAQAFLAASGQLADQAASLPALASEQAAEVMRALAAPLMPSPQSAPPPPSGQEKVKLGSPFLGAIDAPQIASTLAELASRAALRPDVLLDETTRLMTEFAAIAAGAQGLAPPQGDRRYDDPAWRDNPLFRMSLHSHLALTTAITRIIDRTGGDAASVQRMRYVTGLVADAMSPDNALPFNPAALKRAMETGGGSLVQGLRNWLKDVAARNPTPAQVDRSAFTVGRDLAATPGAVVFRNEALELIQYRPVTEKVHAIPIMMVPPVVNKFYMMDLAPGRSLVEFLVAKGFQPFMISWRNPSPCHGHWGLDEYAAAMLEASEAIRDIAGVPDINVFTICTGAVPLAAYLGHVAAKGMGGIKSATTVVSIVDSNEGRSLGLFATPQAIEEAKRRSAAKGVLSGEEMAQVFTWMRPKDLVWNYWVNNYLMGRSPPALDMLYWNTDSTRLAARMHAQLLDVFSKDLLVTPGAMSVLGTPIDLAQVKCDAYVVAGITDHISVWKGVYASAAKFGGSFDFVLHSSGHVQSVVTPPGTPKAKHWVNPETPDSPEAWLAGAEARADSWWPHWAAWLARRSGCLRPAPGALGSAAHPPGAAAPGLYVVEP